MKQPSDAVRALSSVSPALGLIAAHQFHAVEDFWQKRGSRRSPGSAAVRADHLDIQETIDSVRIRGSLSLVPIAACSTLLIIARGRGHLVPLSQPGVKVTPTPAIGFRAAALADITLDCSVKKQAIMVSDSEHALDAGFYLAIALGAGDYLCKRVKEHALGRVQFPGQMQDTEGRDGIAKLGAVKALIARTEAWRLLLETLYDAAMPTSAIRNPHSAFRSCSAPPSRPLPSVPKPGPWATMQARSSAGSPIPRTTCCRAPTAIQSLFRFLAPGYGAAARLNAALRFLGPGGHSSGTRQSCGHTRGTACRICCAFATYHGANAERFPARPMPCLRERQRRWRSALRALLAAFRTGTQQGQEQ